MAVASPKVRIINNYNASNKRYFNIDLRNIIAELYGPIYSTILLYILKYDTRCIILVEAKCFSFLRMKQ